VDGSPTDGSDERTTLRRIGTRIAGVALAFATMGATAAVGTQAASAASSKPSIIIGSASFAENETLAYVYGDALKAAGFKVTVKPSLGQRATIEPALDAGKINMLPEYLGAFLDYLNVKAPVESVPATYSSLKSLVGKKGLVLGTYSSATDANAVAVNQQTASKYHLSTISQLKPIASKLTFGGPAECKTTVQCIVGLKKYYGVVFKSFKILDEDGPLTVAALKNDDVQVARIFTSDTTVSSDHFKVLSDPKDFQGAGNIVPVMQKSVATPAVLAVVNKVSAKLTTADLVAFNVAVETGDHANPNDVAQSFVTKNKL
jgi:osmoprotectant transport system substrate-binding protein